ncbi:hypothetical protein RHMOL_Rhmol07G0227800 [Rhododendron molle]|uniref:Uncharacterized protein n=1 Tax=Rhododendron molle TaxID=49168 RepID=A0ACC0N3V8_RHOML|nr:hypothetical protein RHMOL_Rhmol07G0227800 [Rhododendron molle]
MGLIRGWLSGLSPFFYSCWRDAQALYQNNQKGRLTCIQGPVGNSSIELLPLFNKSLRLMLAAQYVHRKIDTITTLLAVSFSSFNMLESCSPSKYLAKPMAIPDLMAPCAKTI